MLRRLVSRAMAVVAIAVAPAIVVPGASQAALARYPVWPSFLSTGCNTVSGGSNGTTISCGTGAFLLTQVNSGYQCSQVDININSFSSGPFIVTATSQDGTQQNTVSINDNGDYYMQFPTFLVNNLLVIQMSAPDSGAMNVGFIATSPCPVAPTNTPVPPTNTPNPSDTATNTATAGPSHTPTTIPTNTPLPSGHNTFTATATPTGTPSPVTPTPTPTPIGGLEYDCGDVSFPLLNCNWTGAVNRTVPPTHWDYPNSNFNNSLCAYAGFFSFLTYAFVDMPAAASGYACHQSVTAHANGNLLVQYQYSPDAGDKIVSIGILGSAVTINSISSSCPAGGASYCIISPASSLTSGTTYDFGVFESGGSTETTAYVIINNTWIQSATGTITPAVPTATVTGSSTPLPSGTPTITPTASNTPIPIPGAQETAIPTDTECPGGCAVAKLTAVPGLGTVTTVDTSPFSPLAHLSLSRSSCQPFGYAQIPVPVIHGTPALGSTTPLSVTWTVPVTGAWTNYNSDGTLNISNTAIQPCAMSEIPTFVWDLTYWLSVLMCAIAWFLWLIGFVGRLSGEETING